eukprot:3887185-Pleurochrysis_carterae.AAC.2
MERWLCEAARKDGCERGTQRTSLAAKYAQSVVQEGCHRPHGIGRRVQGHGVDGKRDSNQSADHLHVSGREAAALEGSGGGGDQVDVRSWLSAELRPALDGGGPGLGQLVDGGSTAAEGARKEKTGDDGEQPQQEDQAEEDGARARILVGVDEEEEGEAARGGGVGDGGRDGGGESGVSSALRVLGVMSLCNIVHIRIRGGGCKFSDWPRRFPRRALIRNRILPFAASYTKQQLDVLPLRSPPCSSNLVAQLRSCNGRSATLRTGWRCTCALAFRGAEVNALTQETKRLKAEADGARQLQATCAAAHASTMAELKGELASTASQADGKIRGMEAEHGKAIG